MKKIGIISDTHSYWDDRYLKHFEPCDEIWHCGDICSMELVEQLAAFRPLRAVCGNCDGGDLRLMFPEVLRFKCEEVDVLMKHIGGYPGRYDASIRRQIMERPPKLFLSGHSHILKVMNDPTLGLLHINPGAAGLQGWQTERTLVRLTIDGAEMRDCEVITLGSPWKHRNTTVHIKQYPQYPCSKALRIADFFATSPAENKTLTL